MSSFNTKVEEINKLAVYPLACGKALSAHKVACVERCIVVLGADNRIYSTCIKGNYHYNGYDSRHVPMFKALQKLGVLSAGAIKQYEVDRKAQEAKSSKMWAAQRVLENAKASGITLTAAQVAKLTINAKES